MVSQTVLNCRGVNRRTTCAMMMYLVVAIMSSSSQADWYPDFNKQPDPYDDPAKPNGKADSSDEESCGIPGSAGPGLHVAIATGNVWTQVPILTTYAEGDTFLDLKLTYNSLSSLNDDGVGRGWTLGFSMPGIAGSTSAGSNSIPLWYFSVPENVTIEAQPQPDACVEGGNTCTINEFTQGHLEAVPPLQVRALLKPGRVVIVDSDGRRNPYYWYRGGYGSPFPHEYYPEPGFVDHITPLYPPAGRDSLLHDLRQIGFPTGPRFRLDSPNGVRFYFTEAAGGFGHLHHIESTRGSQTTITQVTGSFQHPNPTSITDPFGRSVQFVWNGPGGRLSQIIHPIPSQVTTFGYDATGTRLTLITDPMNKSIAFAYDDDGRIVSETLKNGTKFTSSYKNLNASFQEVEGDGAFQGRIIRALNPQSGGSDQLLTIAVENVPGNSSKGFALPRLWENPSTQQLSGQTIRLITGNGTHWNYFRDSWSTIYRRTLEPGQGDFDFNEILDYGGEPYTPFTHEFRRLLSINRYSSAGGGITKTLERQEGNGQFMNGRRNAGRLAKITVSNYGGNSPDLVTDYSYDPNWESRFPGLVANKTEPNQQGTGTSWGYQYNAQGDLTSIRDPYNHFAVTNSTYFGDGRLDTVTETDRRNFHTIMTYSGTGNLTSKSVEIETGLYILTTYAHDPMGRMTMEIVNRGDGTSISTKREYDAMGRQTKVVENFIDNQPSTDTQNLTTYYEYDDHGLLTATVNPRGVRTTYKYDHRNWMWAKTQDAGSGAGFLRRETLYGFDGNGNIVWMVDPNYRTTQFQYDALDRVKWIQDPEGFITTMKRDINGNIIEYHRQRNTTDDPYGPATLVYSASYDGLGRILSYSLPPDHGGPGFPAPQRNYFYSDWTGSGGGCSCSGLGTPKARKITSTILGEVGTTYHEVDLLGRLKKTIKKVGDTSATPDSDDAVVEQEYDFENNLTDIYGPEERDGHREHTHIEFDGANRQKRVTVDGYPGPNVITEYTYNGADRITSVKLPTGHTLNYIYDPADRLAEVVDTNSWGSPAIAEYTYDANGNIRTWTNDQLSNVWVYDYDRLDRVKVIHDPVIETGQDGDRVTSYEYDQIGNVVSTVNNNLVKTCYVYDEIDRLHKVIEDCQESCGGGGGKEKLDGEGEQGTQEEEAMGGGEDEVSSGTCRTTSFEYVYDGRFLTDILDHDGNRTHYDYELGGRVNRIKYPDPDAACVPEDGADLVMFSYGDYESNRNVTRLDQRGWSSTFQFDDLGRMAKRSYTGGPDGPRDENFQFDRSGRLMGADRMAAGSSTSIDKSWYRVYDIAGRVTSEQQGFGTGGTIYTSTSTFSFDTTAKTMTQGISYPGGRSITRVHDRLQRLSSVGDGISIAVNWSYDLAQRRESETRINGTGVWQMHDDHNRITYQGHWSPPSISIYAENHFGYDPVGNRTHMRRNEDGFENRSELYGHDNRNRLTEVERGTLSGNDSTITARLEHESLAGWQQWADLDRRGNWKDYREEVNGAQGQRTAVPNCMNEYENIDPDGDGPLGVLLPEYNESGDMTTNPLGRNVGDPATPTGQLYEYDEEHRVIRVRRKNANGSGSPANQILAEYAYDALGRRVETVGYVDPQTGTALTNARRTRHVFNGLETIQDYDCGTGSTCNATLLREFVWGESNRFPEPIAMVDYTGANGVSGTGPWTYHFLRDVLGSIVGLTDATGNLVERYTYDPYGKTFVEKWTGTAWTATNASSVASPWLWTGQRYDAATGTYHFLYRTYSPTMGRWLQRDPAGYMDGVSLYEYVRSQPMVLVDALGLASDACEKECHRLKQACIATGDLGKTTLAALTSGCGDCEKGCKQACKKRKEEDKKIYGDCEAPDYAGHAKQWWTGNGSQKQGCKMDTDSWRVGQDGDTIPEPNTTRRNAVRLIGATRIGKVLGEEGREHLITFGVKKCFRGAKWIAKTTKKVINSLIEGQDQIRDIIDLPDNLKELYEGYLQLQGCG